MLPFGDDSVLDLLLYGSYSVTVMDPAVMVLTTDLELSCVLKKRFIDKYYSPTTPDVVYERQFTG